MAEEERKVWQSLVASMAEEIKKLTEKVKELEARLNKNSNNSNKPPSSDGPKKGAPKNSRVPSGKSSGGQPGHKGMTKEFSLSPDTVIELKPKTECECGGDIILKTDTFTVRQVTDIQPAKVITVEYRAKEGVCAKCGKKHKASFPEGVDSTVCYGENVQAVVTYLTSYQLLPLKRTTELMQDLFGLKISQGTVVAAGQEAYKKLEDAESGIKQELLESDVIHFDETGMRVKGKTHWLHSVGTQTATLYGIHEGRGYEAMDAIGILPNFRGTAIHDHWKSYYHYDNCAHGECNEHHLRTLKYLHEDLYVCWAGEMICLLLRIKEHIELSKCFGANQLEQADIDEYQRMYHKIIDRACQWENAPEDARRMANRLKKYDQETLLFMMDFDVPFTNNLAERDVRMPKAKQKISGCFRSDNGPKAFARIRGFISTVKKKRRNVFDGLVHAFKGNARVFLYPASS
ncbi:MAG: IS66 family transposase [Treponema sp.]|jgi:transposase|nr:IS66 family transposase [Treponema sp.]